MCIRDRTGEWEYKLKQMEQAALPRDSFMEGIKTLPGEIVKRVKAVSYTHLDVYKRQKMTSRLSGAPASTGKWNNETWLAQAEVSRTADYACLLYTSRCV